MRPKKFPAVVSIVKAKTNKNDLIILEKRIGSVKSTFGLLKGIWIYSIHL